MDAAERPVSDPGALHEIAVPAAPAPPPPETKLPWVAAPSIVTAYEEVPPVAVVSEPPRIVRPDPPPTPAGLELLLLPWPPVPPAAVREPNVDVAPVLPVPPVPAESRRLPPAPPVPTVTLTVPLIETPVEKVTFPPPPPVPAAIHLAAPEPLI